MNRYSLSQPRPLLLAAITASEELSCSFLEYRNGLELNLFIAIIALMKTKRIITELLNNLCRPQIIPEEPLKICLMCLEPEAKTRPCCNSNFCNFWWVWIILVIEYFQTIIASMLTTILWCICYIIGSYTKNKLCPKCNAATRQEKQTGAVFVINVLSEHEECRACLDPGLKRRCCSSYYCNDCFYSQPLCRACDTPVGARSENKLERAKVVPIIIGWCINISILLMMISGALLFAISESLGSRSIFDYRCPGFFRPCSLSVCVDLDPAVSSGLTALPPLPNWQTCSLKSISKLEASACIFDSVLYGETSGLLGYDICYDSFQKGSYVFEDTFEYWMNSSSTSNKMKSALWSTVVNGRTNNFCGSGSGERALSFEGGDGGRFAETVELDIRAGGWVEGKFFLSPLGYDLSHPNCKTNYGGAVNIEYTNNGGHNWTILQTLDPLSTRNEKFFKLKMDLPSGLRMSRTKIRFIQSDFNIVGTVHSVCLVVHAAMRATICTLSFHLTAAHLWTL